MCNQIIFQSSLIYQDQIFQGLLTQKELIWQENQQKYTLSFDDIVGISELEDQNLSASLIFTINTYPLINQKQKYPQRVLKEYQFTCLNLEDRQQWIKAIYNLIRGYPVEQDIQKQHLQIIVNSACGTQKSHKILTEICTVFKKSNFNYSMEKPNNVEATKKIIKEIDLSKIDSIVIIGGDGTIHDVINSLITRKDWEKIKNKPLGIIPGGTGNGLVKSLLEIYKEPYHIISAAFLIVKGKTQPIDLFLTKQNNNYYYSILSLSWGLISDVDIESEKLRFLGSLRNDIYALIRIIFLRKYQGRLSFIPDPNFKINTQININKKDEWYIIEDEFILLWAMNTPWASYKIKPTPLAKLNDGSIDILLVRKGVSRLDLLKAFLLIEEGKHLNLPCCEYYKVSCFRLEPLTNKGILAVDGEKVNYSAIEMEVKTNLINLS